MKIRTGTDIIEIERIKDAIESTEGKFCDRVYTISEIEYCESRNVQKYQHYAARFAAKEAVFKAVSAVLEDNYEISWKDIEICKNENGRPYVNIKNDCIEKIEDIDLSISHCKQYAVASTVVVFK